MNGTPTLRRATRNRAPFALACLSVLGLAALLGAGAPGASGAGAACPNQAFRQGSSTVLTECRAYEMVSPPEKLGSDVMSDATRTRASRDGNRAMFVSLGAFGDAVGTGISTEYMAQRSPGGWSTHSITPVHDPQDSGNATYAFDPRYVGELSDDLRTGVYRSLTPLSGGTGNVEGAKSLFMRRDLDVPGAGGYELLTGAATPRTGVDPEYKPLFAGASADFSHVVFLSWLNLTTDAPAQSCTTPGSASCEPRVYEWTNGEVRLVGLVPVAPATSCSGADCVPATQSIPGQVISVGAYSTDIVSRDGERIFFRVGDLSKLGGALYVREGGTSTTQINVSERAGPGFLQSGTQPATFWAASADGSKVFFTTQEQLTDEPSGLSVNLYRADLDAPVGDRLTLLAVDSETGDPGGLVDRVYGVSSDGSYAYFSAFTQLITGEQLRAPGDTMVYVWHEGALRFVTTMLDFEDGGENASPFFTLSQRPARVSPDGQSFLFVSRSPNVGVGSSALCDAGLPCRRLYLFNADGSGGAGSLACVSCRPGGAASSTDALVMPKVGIGGSAQDPHLNHPLTDDGRLVFFSTGDRLVPEDTNGRYDAYVYDTTTAKAQLISSGECNCDSYFMEASADGSDAFFTTRQRLVGWDVDGAVDLYDARIGGGFPEPTPPTPSCQGDACQPPPVTLNDPTPASSGYSGPGSRVAKKHHRRKAKKHRKRRHAERHGRANQKRVR